MTAFGGKPDWSADLLARAVAAIAALNLNGVTGMVTNVGEIASVPLLLFALILILKTGRYAASTPLVLLFAAITAYLVLATMYFDPIEAIHPPEKYYRTYISSVILIWALSGYVGSLQPGPRLVSFLEFTRNCFLISALSVWASPLIYPFFVNLPPSSVSRMGGFFGNPNEAAAASLFAVGLTLALPFQVRLLQRTAIAVAAGAVILTFSKSGMAILVLLLGWHVFRSTQGIWRFALILGLIILLVLIQDFDAFLVGIADSPLLDLDASQHRRLLAVADILSGKVDATTTTGRTELWGLVLAKSWENFPFGTGLGTAHHIVGGIIEGEVWQGAHNTFLMLLGEAGPLPPLLVVAAVTGIAHHALFRARGDVERYALPVLGIELLATHSALGTRYTNLMLAIVLGLLARTIRLRSTRNTPEPRYSHASYAPQPLGQRPR
jgi:hypothetical protein